MTERLYYRGCFLYDFDAEIREAVESRHLACPACSFLGTTSGLLVPPTVE
jgi:hypothetical protein